MFFVVDFVSPTYYNDLKKPPLREEILWQTILLKAKS